MTEAIVVALIALGVVMFNNIFGIAMVAIILKNNPDKFQLTLNKTGLTEVRYSSKAGEQ